MGDGVGVGPEIIVKALADCELRSKARMLVIGHLRRMQLAAGIVSSPLTLRKVSGPSRHCSGKAPSVRWMSTASRRTSPG
ncbi:MAG: hypothetical protein NVSMB43_01260 [Pseudarthrobacter sp.]